MKKESIDPYQAIRKHLSPALVLFFLSPVIAELLSSSMPPLEFFNPPAFVYIVVLYGSSAILVRELVKRWNKGCLTLLTLGAVYGIIHEGLTAKSFFNPNWMDIGIFGSYGRWAGINWLWCFQVTIYHTVFSIAVPVLLVELMFPAQREEPWISNRTFITLYVLLLGVVSYGSLVANPYSPRIVLYLITIVIVIGLIALAWKMPEPSTPAQPVKTRPPCWFWLAGFLAAIFWVINFWGLPYTYTELHPLLAIIIYVGMTGLIGWGIFRMSGNSIAWSDTHQLAFAAGILSFFILLTPLNELDKTRPDDPKGMTIVGLMATAFLIWMARRIGLLRKK